MKTIRTKGRGAEQTAEILAALERRGGAALDTVLPASSRIVADVRKQATAHCLYAAQFDGLAGASSLRVTPTRWPLHGTQSLRDARSAHKSG